MKRHPPHSTISGPAALLAALAMLAFLPAARAGFIFDDARDVVHNALLGDFGGLLRIWMPRGTPQYYPVVYTSFWIEHHLWGLAPAGYHIVNFVLHALNALLVWRLCVMLEIPGAWFVAAVFAIHPVQVESVAWIAERKNILSAFCYLVAAILYLRFEAQREKLSASNAVLSIASAPASPQRAARRKRTARQAPPAVASVAQPPGSHWRLYAISLCFFVLALLSKTIACSLPAALILMMLWQRRRLTLLRLAPLLPMFTVGLALAINTALLERTSVGAVGPEFQLSLLQRALIACRALVFYPGKLLFPWPLMFTYPRWIFDTSNIASWWPAAIIAIVAVAATVAWRRGARGPALALAFFAGTIFPALGFFNIAYMRVSFVADHFQYLASLGLIALLVGVAARFLPNRRTLQSGAALLALLFILSWRQSFVYTDEATLWRYTAKHNPGSWIAHENLGAIAADQGNYDEALKEFRLAQSLASSTKAANEILLNCALTLRKAGRPQGALDAFQQLQQAVGGMEVNLAQTFEDLKRDREAEAFYRQALSGANRAEALLPFGMHLMRVGRPAEAIPIFDAFSRLHQQDADSKMFLADAYAAAGRTPEAVGTAQRALTLARAQHDDDMADLIGKRLEQYAGRSISRQ